jgi:hypothetical protein
MGLELAAAFAAAGMPVEEMRLECALGAGEARRVWGWSDVVESMVPLIEQLGVATTADVEPETLAERLLAELRSTQGIVIGPPLIAAWARRPASASEQLPRGIGLPTPSWQCRSHGSGSARR